MAICNAERTVATPLETIERVDDRTVEHGRVAELIDDNDIVVVVVGLPLSLDGTIGPAAKAILREVKALRKRLGIEVVTHDERLTTVTATSALRAQGVDSRRGRSVVDQLAASVILQSWLDHRPPADQSWPVDLGWPT